ncbi:MULTISPECIES: TP0733 family outer membrane beta-barrel protein [Treponema]|jgi:hypothetical protein|uniref:Outer membrane protein beta-barrel domain-containing protein n=1 Tax=Treponema saccharophilum DSM 2985 TaxID=907348 RepID=H7EIR1_9SPIR|nr:MULTISPECIES: hypothetical protein [Treponema]EIC02489.1 hypothetical protein TresaDRAFT_2367 [Treponema saccharophilum DSM 2985]MBQ5538397.1 hypothetical protein [Treponema sp.]BDC96931.1 hypothetical protein TRSA_20300 [Treponema saccharophilum]
MVDGKKMRKIIALFCAFAVSCASLFAQSDDESEPQGDEYFEEQFSEMNVPGDQFIKFGLMATFPCNFGGTFPTFRTGQLSLGGAGEIGYHRFVTNNIAWGIDISFGYNPTIGENMYTYVPVLFDVMFQPTFKKFEFPIALGVGGAMESYLSKTYFPAFVAKGEAGVFYRVAPQWSFGLNGQCMYMPQWYSDSKYNDYGIFASFEIVARYHF